MATHSSILPWRTPLQYSCRKRKAVYHLSCWKEGLTIPAEGSGVGSGGRKDLALLASPAHLHFLGSPGHLGVLAHQGFPGTPASQALQEAPGWSALMTSGWESG